MIKQRQQDNNNMCTDEQLHTESRERERDRNRQREQELSVTTNEKVRTK